MTVYIDGVGQNTTNSAGITDGSIVNADISASAAIALSKLATDPLARANHTGTQAASTVTGTALVASTADAKGDLYVATAADTVTRLAVGSDGTLPVANAGASAGLNYGYGEVGGLFGATRAKTTIKAANFDPTFISTGQGLADGQIRAVPVYLPYSATITGVVWMVHTQGNYTADNSNQLGLYTSDGTNLTLVASSTSADDLWSASAANTIKQTAFSSPYAASAGVYWIAALYNSSAQTTAPSLASRASGISGNQHDILMADTDEFMCWALSSQASLPASQAWSGVTASGANPFLGLY